MTSSTKLKLLIAGATPRYWRTRECPNGGLLLLRGQESDKSGHAQTHLQIVPKEDAEFICYLANHADDIVALIDAAEPALRYIEHVGANHVMRGEPHPQEKIVTDLQAALTDLNKDTRDGEGSED